MIQHLTLPVVRRPAAELPDRVHPRPRRIRVGLLGVLRPVMLATAGLIGLYGALWIGTGYVRSWQRSADYAQPVHEDRSAVAVPVARQVPEDKVAVGYHDASGQTQRALAARTAVDAFVASSAAVLEEDRRQAQARLADELKGQFNAVFGDGEERVRDFGDWYFAWGRPWDLLWQGASSAVTRLGEARVETLREAVQRDLSDYFMQGFTAQVLRPELRDPALKEGVRRTLVSAHDRYLAAVRAQDLRLQLFLARETTHLDLAPGAEGDLRLAFDWEAQRWKAPADLMGDRELDGLRSAVTLGAGGALAGATLRPVFTELLAGRLGGLAAETAGGVAGEVEAGAAGGTAGSWVPGLGTALGAATGVATAVAVDYAWNKGREWSDRPAFEARTREALTAIRTTWEARVAAELHRVVDVWFEDAEAALGPADR